MKTKTCTKCGSTKPSTEFYKHPSTADGRLGECKECTRARVLARRLENIEYVRAYDRRRGKEKHRIQNSREQTRRWRAEDSRRTAAHNAVARALRNGRISKHNCKHCGSADSMAHHECYDNKLDVTWLCQPCHKARHKEMVLEGIEP